MQISSTIALTGVTIALMVNNIIDHIRINRLTDELEKGKNHQTVKNTSAECSVTCKQHKEKIDELTATCIKQVQSVDQTCQVQINATDQRLSNLSSEFASVKSKQEYEEKTLWNQDQKLSSISSEVASVKSKQEYEEKTLWSQDQKFSSISSDVASIKSKQEYEEKTLWSQDYIILSLFILSMGEVVVFLLVIKGMRKLVNKSSGGRYENGRNERLGVLSRKSNRKLTLEDSLAIVSFNESQVEKHRQLTESITSIPQNKIDSINISRGEDIWRIKSKIALVYVDFNDRNIILESDQELGDIRRTTVEDLKKQGVAVIVIYCHHKESKNLQNRLYCSSLTSIQRHETLKKLAAEKCVFSIFSDFSEFQKQHLAEKLKLHITL